MSEERQSNHRDGRVEVRVAKGKASTSDSAISLRGLAISSSS